MTVPTKPDGDDRREVRQDLDAVMIRQVRSPLARAASTKSRRRSDRVWARSTRAPHAQPVRAMTAATREPARRRQLAGDDDDQRQLRDDQEDVGQRRQRLVADAAEVARGDADEHADDRRDDAGQEADDHDAAGADEDLATGRPGRGGWCRASARRTAAAGWPRDSAFGSYGAIHGADDARRTAKNPRITRPVRDLRVAQEAGTGAGPAPGAVGVGGDVRCLRRTSASTVMSALLAGARVEDGVGDVGQHVRDEHGERDDEEARPA